MKRLVEIDIEVAGIGCLSALGRDFSHCLDGLFRGLRNCGPPTSFAPHPGGDYPVFQVNDSALDWLPGSEQLSRTARLALLAADEAVRRADLGWRELKTAKVGVCLGTTVGSAMNKELFYQAYRRGETPPLDELHRYLQSNPAEAVARHFSLQGPVMTVSNACSSGTDALGVAMDWLAAGVCDYVLAGGCDELSHVSYLGFISLMVAATEPCRPFDRERKGLNLGEGAAVLLLQRGRSKRGSACHLVDYRSCGDAYHLTAPHPEGRGLRSVLEPYQPLARSGELAFINAHGTATLDNDRVEMAVLAELFPGCPYLSVKGGTGHTLGASGAIEAALTVGCLQRRLVPPSIGFVTLPDKVKYGPVSETRCCSGDYAISQSLAFGGSNSAVLFRRGE